MFPIKFSGSSGLPTNLPRGTFIGGTTDFNTNTYSGGYVNNSLTNCANTYTLTAANSLNP